MNELAIRRALLDLSIMDRAAYRMRNIEDLAPHIYEEMDRLRCSSIELNVLLCSALLQIKKVETNEATNEEKANRD